MANNPETSVMFSLAELARIEDERVREEESLRARARADRAREQALEMERRRAEEEARIAREKQARAEREREEAAREALLEARKRAEIDAVRIAAEARARLEADDAARAHELAVMRARAERYGKRLQHGLMAAIAVLLLGGAAAVQNLTTKTAKLEAEAAELRARLGAAESERERAAKDQRADRDRDEAALRRKAMLQQIEELDRRHADLAAWAAQRGKTNLTAAARVAAARTHASHADERTLERYRKALDDLSTALGGPVARRVPTRPNEPVGKECTNPNDPMCGFDGTMLR